MFLLIKKHNVMEEVHKKKIKNYYLLNRDVDIQQLYIKIILLFSVVMIVKNHIMMFLY